MYQKALIGTATRYIAGRNAVQTVYWRTISDADGTNSKLLKVAKTFKYGNTKVTALPPAQVQGECNIRFS